ncbi:MAG: potassium channel family protein [Bryobacteraceae bacterium]
MIFVRQVGASVVLVTLTLSLQCAGMTALIVWARGYLAKSSYRFGPFRCAELMVKITTAMIWLQVFETLLWTAFYRWQCFPSWENALYFSAASYSTVGYGDVILPRVWRLLGPVESVTGVLMCGLSASLLFAVVTRLVGHEESFETVTAKDLALTKGRPHSGEGS